MMNQKYLDSSASWRTRNDSGAAASAAEMKATREGFGLGLVKAGQENEKVVGLCCDLTDSVKMSDFKKEFPARFFEIGVAEQNMVGVAAGLALAGFIPFAASYAVFSPGRSWDQIRVSVCYSNLNVKIVGAHTGLSVGPDGATHQALEDIAITRVLPNMTVVAPIDAVQAQQATLALARHIGPAYLRLTREATPVIMAEEATFKIGVAQILAEGADLTFVGCGPILDLALQASKKLVEKNISACVINMHTIKPLDEMALSAAAKTGLIITLEEHQIIGGLGSAVAEFVTEHKPVPVLRFGIQDSFAESGPPEALWQKYGLTLDNLLALVEKGINLKLKT